MTYVATEIHPTAIVDETHGLVQFGSGCTVAPFASLYGPLVLGDNVSIGTGCVIGSEAEHITKATRWDVPIHILVAAYLTRIQRCVAHSSHDHPPLQEIKYENLTCSSR